MAGDRVTLDRSRRPSPGPAPRIRLPSFQRRQLPNGLTVLSVRHDDLPQTSARLILPYGAVEDADDRAGQALLTVRALTEGTTERSAREVAEAIDFLGAEYRADVTHDATVISLGFLSRVFDEAANLLAEIVARPAFAEEEVARLRDERLDEIASHLDEPRAIASLRLGEAIFGPHPYGTDEGGLESSVATIEASDLRDFHGRFYRPSSATLVLVGEVPEPDELAERLGEAFGGWTGDAVDARDLAEPSPLNGRRTWGIQWAGPQSEIRVGDVGIARRDPDYAAVTVMNSILGGLFSSRINMNLREDKGWTYGARSRFDARKRRGPFYAATAVDSTATAGAIREILGEMDRMKTEPPDDEELALARNALTFSLPRLFETAGQVSARVAHQVIYGLPDDYWERYSERVRAVTRDDVVRAAETHLRPERAAVVVVGPVVGDLRSELEALGPLEQRDVRGRPVP